MRYIHLEYKKYRNVFSALTKEKNIYKKFVKNNLRLPGPNSQVILAIWFFLTTLLVAERVQLCPSFRPSVLSLSRHFLKIVSLVFSKFWHGARNPYEAVCDSQISWKNFFCSQYLENEQKVGHKLGILNLLKNLVFNFY